MREMNGLDLDQALSEVENGYIENSYGENVAMNQHAYDICVKNVVSHAKVSLYVYPNNTLEQVLDGTEKNLNWSNAHGKILTFVNERTGQSTTDTSMTLEEFQIGSNDLLSVDYDNNVAAE